jgi:gamma-glutamyl-gamma-aminobutyrate hydrolase PuuD
VQPHLYGENGDEPDADPGRDLLSMALINAALERRIPIFAICRGLQELVVATGGTLYRRLFEQPELLNIAKILNCPSSSNMRRPMKFRFRKEDYFLS